MACPSWNRSHGGIIGAASSIGQQIEYAVTLLSNSDLPSWEKIQAEPRCVKGMTSQTARKLRLGVVVRGGTTSQLSEKLTQRRSKRQGTTSVVPQNNKIKGGASAPAGCSLPIPDGDSKTNETPREPGSTNPVSRNPRLPLGSPRSRTGREPRRCTRSSGSGRLARPARALARRSR